MIKKIIRFQFIKTIKRLLIKPSKKKH